jgi:hypothetical protein
MFETWLIKKVADDQIFLRRAWSGPVDQKRFIQLLVGLVSNRCALWLDSYRVTSATLKSGFFACIIRAMQPGPEIPRSWRREVVARRFVHFRSLLLTFFDADRAPLAVQDPG